MGPPAMTPAEFREAIVQVGLSQAAAGLWFGRSRRTGQRWANGTYPVPDYVARFLRYMVIAHLTPSDIDWASTLATAPPG
jgi:hypothetical protein